jgi:hypothetical protein
MISIELIKSIEHNIMNEALFQPSFEAFNILKSKIETEEDEQGDIELLKIHGQTSEDESSKFIVLSLFANKYKQVIITSIKMPSQMQKQGFGMKMIEIVFNTSENEGYDCFITDMLPSFYHKMLTRGAREAGDNEDAVKIMKSTRLC